jgi:hypothetical protein
VALSVKEAEVKHQFVVRGRPSWLQVPRKSRSRLLGTGVLLSGGEGFEAGDGVRGCWVVVEKEEGQPLWMRSCSEVDGILEW